MAKVVLENLVKTFREKNGPEVRAVNGINLTVEDHEFMVIVGPSGCGKSTTLRLIAGLEDASAGSVSIDGRVVNDVPPKDRDIAMVFQNYALYPHMSVYENMAFGLKLRKFPKPEIEARVREAASLLGLESHLERKPKALSGGQRQRVAVGRAIVRKPKVFLFDEPLSNLDAKMRVAMRMELSRLHVRLGATMIYVTHDQVEAMTMGDRICVMKDGDVMQVDPPLALYNHPRNQFVAGFIGSPPMNLFRGQIRRVGDRFEFAEDGGTPDPIRLELPANAARAAALRGDRPVFLGIRPEDLNEADAGAPLAAAQVEAKVELCEPMGAEVYLHFRGGPSGFVARVRSTQPYNINQTVRLSFDLARMHLFDPATGEALTGNGSV
jgi:multiple sugar transport system ATP-binding protein